jgi:hypothetical protein
MSSDAISDEARFADAIEAAAMCDFFAAAPPEVVRALRIRTVAIGGATALVAGAVPNPFLNRVIGLGVHAPANDAELDRIADVYRGADARTHWIHLTPGARPPQLPASLARRGYTQPARRSWAKMIGGHAPPPPVETAFEVRRARPDEYDSVAAAITVAYGMPALFAAWFAGVAGRPAWRTYVALNEGRAVGGGFLYLDRTGAWLGADGVQPAFRGRHAQRALMALRVCEAIEAGCARIATETGDPLADEPNPSLTNMLACGFCKVCSRLNYVAPA